MILLRSALYHLLFATMTLTLGVLYLPLLLAPRATCQRFAMLWVEGALWLQRRVLGLSCELRGLENLPPGPVLIAAKHQSAWDTLIFHHLLRDPAIVIKRELLFLPVIGWYLWKSGQIAIDRGAGAKALRGLATSCRRAVEEGREVVIFPEGHRQPPGTTGQYQPGIALLRHELGVPVVPVALNSGLFWGRNAFLRYPGRVLLQILPPMKDGLDRRRFMAELETRIETATRALEVESLSRQPSLARDLAGPVDKSVEDSRAPEPPFP